MNSAEGEAALDAEWAGAVAPDASVELASCADTATNFGAFIAAQNLLDLASPPPIMSLSYIECEAGNGPGPQGNGYVNNLWQQAAGEGVSVFIASGDGAAAGCDPFDTATYAIGGIAANGLASTPYNVATGGTDFLDASENSISTYWSNTNTASGKSAKSYIPETPWNDSCASSILFTFYGYTDGLTSATVPSVRVILTSPVAAAHPASFTPSLIGRRGSQGFRTMASVIYQMFPCLPRTASGSMRFCIACPMRPSLGLPAITPIPQTLSITVPAVLPLRLLNLPVSRL